MRGYSPSIINVWKIRLIISSCVDVVWERNVKANGCPSTPHSYYTHVALSLIINLKSKFYFWVFQLYFYRKFKRENGGRGVRVKSNFFEFCFKQIWRGRYKGGWKGIMRERVRCLYEKKADIWENILLERSFLQLKKRNLPFLVKQ